MPETRTRIGAITLAAVVVLSLLAPAAAAAATSSDDLDVTTEQPTDVSETEATLNGNLTDLGNATHATVSFEYWPGNDTANATTLTVDTLNESGSFAADVDGLSPNTSYTVVATATSSDGTNATGEAVSFQTDDAFDVRTDEPADVNETAATLRGTVTDLGSAETATVRFEYWRQGDAGNATETAVETVNETGEFSARVTGLASNVTYVYAASAQPDDANATETGEEVAFDTVVEEWEDEDQPFGHRLAAFIEELTSSPLDGPLGVYVSEWVVANNPGADNRPDHAGPDDGGPPDHASGNATDDESSQSDLENDSGNSTDAESETGPPEHANGNSDDDGERGPPDHANDDAEDGDDEEELEDEADDDDEESEDEDSDDEEAEDDEDEEDEDDDDDDGSGPPEHANNDG